MGPSFFRATLQDLKKYYDSLETGRTLNVHKVCMPFLCNFNRRLVSRGDVS